MVMVNPNSVMPVAQGGPNQMMYAQPVNQAGMTAGAPAQYQQVQNQSMVVTQ